MAIKKMMIFAVLLVPGAIMAPSMFIETGLEARAFSEGKSNRYRDNLRIYGFYESKGRGGTSYYVRVHPYRYWAEFRVSEQEYRKVAASTDNSLGYIGPQGYPFCVAVSIEQVGVAVRALSPGRALNADRQIRRCPPGGLRSEYTS